MKISIILIDNMVVVDGVAREVPDLAAVCPAGVHAIQVKDGVIQTEWSDKKQKREIKTHEMDPIVAAWQDAARVAVEPPPVLSSNPIEEKVNAMWDALADGDSTKMDVIKAERLGSK